MAAEFKSREPGEFACPKCQARRHQPCKRWDGDYCTARVRLAEKKTREAADKRFGKPWE